MSLDGYGLDQDLWFISILSRISYICIFNIYLRIIPQETYLTYYTLKLVSHIASCFVKYGT